MVARKKNPRRAATSTGSEKSKQPRSSKRAAKLVGKPRPEQGPEAARLQAALRESIERDIAARIAAHQREVARLRVNVRRGLQPPLMLLSHGDSWFNYPLNGNRWPSPDTDIIAHLTKMGSPPPKILNISHYGDATTDEMGLPKQRRPYRCLK